MPKRVRIAGPVHYRQQHHNPPLSEARLRRESEALADAAIEPSTRRNYISSFRHWSRFVLLYNKADVPTVESLCLFIAYARTRLQHVDKVLAALAWFFKPIVPDWDAIRSHPNVTRRLSGVAKLNARPIRQATPLCPSDLSSIVRAAAVSQATDDILVACIATIAFCCCMRLGELVVNPGHQDDRKFCLRSSVRLVPGRSFAFVLPFHKGDRFYRSSPVTLTDANACADFDPILVIETYLRLRDAVHGLDGFLFLREDGSVPTKHWFMGHVRRHARSASGHSFRSGGATFLALAGMDAAWIQRLGRWSSASWERYIRASPDVLIALQRRQLAAPRN